MRRLKKKIFLGLSLLTLASLAVVRYTCIDRPAMGGGALPPVSVHVTESEAVAEECPQPTAIPSAPVRRSRQVHPVRGVRDLPGTFCDMQDVQLQAAQRWGITPCATRAEIADRQGQLLYVGCNPYYDMDPSMTHSVPYLVPRASLLLQDVGRSFLDSLHVKGLPPHRIVVTSVLRTDEDVARLRPGNANATQNSCHRYGTTVDIGYYRYHVVSPYREVSNDRLMWVLSEVLRDLRAQGRCYVRYEQRQSCFHITVR